MLVNYMEEARKSGSGAYYVPSDKTGTINSGLSGGSGLIDIFGTSINVKPLNPGPPVKYSDEDIVKEKTADEIVKEKNETKQTDVFNKTTLMYIGIFVAVIVLLTTK